MSISIGYCNRLITATIKNLVIKFYILHNEIKINILRKDYFENILFPTKIFRELYKVHESKIIDFRLSSMLKNGMVIKHKTAKIIIHKIIILEL